MKHLSKEDDMLLVHTSLGQLKMLFSELLQEHLSSSNQPDVIGIEEVMEMTGLTKNGIYNLTHRKLIPHYRAEHGGRRLYFKRSEITSWLMSNRIATNEEAFQNHLEGVSKKRSKSVMTKQAEIEFLRRNLREAKVFLRLWQFIHSLLLIQADKNYEEA